MATAEPLTHCPTCGVQLNEQNRKLSICAYCASPLRLDGERKDAVDDATRRRLAVMREHDDWAEAHAWDPPPGYGVALPSVWRGRGTFLLLLGVVAAVFAALPLLRGVPALDALRSPWALLGLVLVVVGFVLRLRGAPPPDPDATARLEKRPAIVLDRRSETRDTGGTTYYFRIAFEDGELGEFRYLGRGTEHEVLANGSTGLAFTRGGTLVEFTKIRV